MFHIAATLSVDNFPWASGAATHGVHFSTALTALAEGVPGGPEAA
jgi:hypothetical protein